MIVISNSVCTLRYIDMSKTTKPMRNSLEDFILPIEGNPCILFDFPPFTETVKAMEQSAVATKRKLSPLRESQILHSKSQKGSAE